ncbi:MAG: tRNA preQ1(34) S-adenosylmethionine ribosyltransferase-isomerase QueA [Candidatus Falkowbacteria bacterium]|nr:tRNA preQ1(34) S-adenosylmethionine ribosyltransferase-isomerase QueA [Candidatus Falkowbacteria bacterium]
MKEYQLSDFDYNLPSELIAQEAISPRDHSRLLVLDSANGKIAHQHFFDLPKLLRSGDVLVLNDSKVFPARLLGKKKVTGGGVEVFLHQKKSEDIWECLIGGKVKPGMEIEFSSDFFATILISQENIWQVKFNLSGDNLMKEIFRLGITPLPPYIKSTHDEEYERARYQTVYANNNKLGSVAAPTAGLHFTPELLKEITSKGVEVVTVTLHVGLGTFLPVKIENLADHKMHSEYAEISLPVIKKIIAAKKSGQRIIAVGTTACRTLESFSQDFDYQAKDEPRSFGRFTDIFIRPGYQFKIIDGLITNFHLPKSTLLMLISAFAGKEKIDLAYQEAINQRYRFFSYGDAMIIAPKLLP